MILVTFLLLFLLQIQEASSNNDTKLIAVPESEWMNGFVKLSSPIQMKPAYPPSSFPSSLQPISWKEVVIIIMTYDNILESQLIQKHFETWISRMPETLDVVFVTDKDDRRSFDEILPHAASSSPTIHLYRTTQTNEGAQARLKTLKSLLYAYSKFQYTSKEYFLKVDPDTFVIPENLLINLKEIHQKTYPGPVDFGRVDCARHKTCYTLGASYGMSKAALQKSFEYIEENPKVFNLDFPEGRLIIKNRMMDEDFFTSYVFQKATSKPSIHVSGMSIRLFARNYKIRGPPEGEWSDHKNYVSTIHLVKCAGNFTKLFEFYYNMKKEGEGTENLITLKKEHLIPT